MAPLIRVDDEVWTWLKGHARPLEDTPNSVLRRIAGLEVTRARRSRNRLTASAGDKLAPPRHLLREQFRTKISQFAQGRRVRVEDWNGGERAGKNILKLSSGKRTILLYFKTRSESTGFWGVTPARLEALRASQLRWYLLFLLGPSEKCYVLSATEVERAILEGRWNVADDGDYKVHEGRGLQGFDYMEGFDRVLSRVITSIKDGDSAS